jgi:hypothetical protein
MMLGVSVSPSKVRMSFEPSSFYEGTVKFGTGGNTNHLGLSAGGDFNVTLDKYDIYCDIEPCEVNYTVISPESFETPGLKVSYVAATEVFDEDPQGFMSFKVSMSMPIYIDVPYPGKYMEWTSLEAENVAAGDTTTIVGKLISRGTDNISEVSGNVLIFDNKKNLIGSAATNTVHNVATDEPITLGTKWNSGDYKQGNYKAEMRVNFDGERTNRTVGFKLGGLNVSMINYSDHVVLGGIKSFFVTVDSIWSEQISNVRANVSIYNYSNSKDQAITSFETLTKPLGAWGTETLVGYVDTSLFNVSVYDAKIKLYFADQFNEYDAKINFSLPPKIVEPKKKLNLFSKKNLLIMLGVALLIALIVLIYAFIPKKKNSNSEQQALKK